MLKNIALPVWGNPVNLLTGKKIAPEIKRNHEYFKQFNHKSKLVDCEFTVIDTEMTGLEARRHEVLSLGAVRIRNLSIVASETFYTLVEPKKGPSIDNTLIHRITPEQLKGAPRLRKVLPELLEYIGSSLIIGHHIGLDMAFLNIACKTVFGDKMLNPCIDTMRMAMVYEEENWKNYYDRYDMKVSYNLSDLADKYGLPKFEAHNALQDAMQTAYLFLLLVRKLRQGGIETLQDLFQAGRSWRWYF